MSNVNIKRAIGNIRSSTTVYTPIVETIVNGIQAIEEKKEVNGTVLITVIRSSQQELDDKLPKIVGIKVRDNGIGFTQANRNSFDTLYSDYKLTQGGKGFGRFTCLKYFERMTVESTYFDNGFKIRKFRMGLDNEIIVDEVIAEANSIETGTEVSLENANNTSLNQKLSTVARSLVEMLLPYFITKDYVCPKITLSEIDDSNSIILNDYLGSTDAVIREIPLTNNSFSLGENTAKREFEVRVFKIFSPRNKVSKISLVAHKREVTETPIHNFIPEFLDEFYEKSSDGGNILERNFIIKTYVTSPYLDENVSLERGAFEFPKESDFLCGISQTDIEKKSAELTKQAVSEEIKSRQDKKRERIENYVEQQAPWHKTTLKSIDSTSFPVNSSDADIESLLQREKFKAEMQIRSEIIAIMKDDDSEELLASISNVVSKISEQSKNDLVHYVAMRRKVLEIFRKSLEMGLDEKYASETAVHDILFPTKSDSLSTSYEDHNLWIIDERLNFTSYISSDLPLKGGKSERPDLIVYNRRIAFRGDNEASNPVTVFEFKKPGRDDFVNPSSKEDPVQQIIRYVNSIRAGEYLTPKGTKIHVADNTPFYGYAICSLTPKVERWLRDEKDFKPMPDKLGWFKWIDNINLYIEIISWDKLLRDADMRNKVFFQTLGI
jgi:ribosome-associated translation inhibitor RaiA